MTTKRLVKISYFTMLTIIGSLLRIPVGPVMFTFQNFFVILSGFVLGKKDGPFSQIAYMVLGLIGLPIFTQGGGIGYVLLPSFGYIFSFFISSFTAAFIMGKFKTIKVWHIFFAGVMALVPMYLIGMTYQVIIYIVVNEFTFAAAMATLVYMPFLFFCNSTLLLLLSLFYPRIMTMIGSTAQQKFTDNGMKNQTPASGAAKELAAAQDQKETLQAPVQKKRSCKSPFEQAEQ